MANLKKYEGIIPALYACYDDNGAVSIERTKALTQWFIDQGVNGLYVGGSSGECIYQTKDERKAVLEAVMEVAKGKIQIGVNAQVVPGGVVFGKDHGINP